MPDLPDLMPLDAGPAPRPRRASTALPSEVVDLADAAGLVLAEPVRSALTLPSWTNSAMDGFAVRGSRTSRRRPAATRRAPGPGRGRRRVAPRAGALRAGTAIRIMTGAMLPDGADTVVPVEDTDAPAGASEIPASVAIRAAGAPR